MIAKIVLALDFVAATLLTLAFFAAAFDGFRIRLGAFRFSTQSPVRLLLIALLILGIRHVLQRTRPFHVRALAGVREALTSEAFRAALAPWLMIRVGVLAVGFLAIATIGYGPAALPFRWSDNDLVNLQARWDAGWYMGIAMEGYQWDPLVTGQQSFAFMPALPWTIQGAAKLLGYQWNLAGHAVALVIPLLGLAYLHRLAARIGLGDRERVAALLLFAAYPFALFHSAIYTEALFTLAAAAAFFHQLKGEYLRAVLFAVVAGLARPNGFLLAVPLAVLALQTHLPRREWAGARVSARTWLLSGLPALGAVAGMAGFCVFVWDLTGDPLTWLHSHAAWGRTYAPIMNLVKYPAIFMWHSGVFAFILHDPMHVLNGAATLLALTAVWPCYRRFGPAYAVFILVNLLPPLFAGGLLSVGRLTSTLFPVFLWLAVALPGRWAWPVAAVFAMGQGLGAVLFYTWRPFL